MIAEVYIVKLIESIVLIGFGYLGVLAIARFASLIGLIDHCFQPR